MGGRWVEQIEGDPWNSDHRQWLEWVEDENAPKIPERESQVGGLAAEKLQNQKQ